MEEIRHSAEELIVTDFPLMPIDTMVPEQFSPAFTKSPISKIPSTKSDTSNVYKSFPEFNRDVGIILSFDGRK